MYRAAILCLALVLLGCPGEPPPPPAPPTYVVAAGDSLGVIAQRHGVTVKQLRDWNGIEGSLIHPGQELIVGQVGDAPVAAAPKRSRSAGRSGSRAATRSTDGAPPEEVPTARPPLRRPAPKACLDAATGIEDGASFGRSQGLSSEQISASVATFQTEALRCYDDHPTAAGEVVLRLDVGCDGLVRASRVHRDATGAGGFAACVAETFRFAAFPAHARDVVEVEFPLRFTAP